MRLYQGTVEQFKNEILHNRLVDLLTNNFENYYKKKANVREIRAWDNSLTKFKDVLDTAQLWESNIIVEHELPFSEKRIDVLLFGQDRNVKDNIIVVELKQWSNENVEESLNEGNIIVDFGTFKKESPHPSLQVEGYYWHLKDYMTIFEESNTPLLNACIYCHNYNRGATEVLYLPKFKQDLEHYPLFSKQDMIQIGAYLKEKLSEGKGQKVLERFNLSILKPSPKLLEHTSAMINKQQIFNLIDEQRTAYNAIMSKAKHLSKSQEKAVIIVKGGPGTGKSVIALEVMGELLRRGKNVYHATGSSAFTNTLRKILGTRSSKQFKFFNSFMKFEGNNIDVLICDEAHRIRKTSESRYTPSSQRTGEPQINELIKAAKLSVFFIDEKQIVRPNEMGSVNLIKNAAIELGVDISNIYEDYKLEIQFRCGGSARYVNWLEDMLGMQENESEISFEEDGKMEFKILDSPTRLAEIINMKNQEKPNCARIVAGFCWPWSAPRGDGSLVNDVQIGDFQWPWERKDQFWRWATDDSGMQQVGTVYTAQGFEFDYIGVIFGNDLVYNKTKKKWEAKPNNSHDIMVTRNNENLVNHFKNVYRVLLSRAHKGVYVYFMDKDTEEYFRMKKSET